MLLHLTRRQKRSILLLFDTALVPAALYVAFSLRYGTSLPLEALTSAWPLLVLLTVSAPLVSLACRLPWIKLSAIDGSALARFAFAAVTLGLFAMATSFVFAVSAPRSIPIIFSALVFSGYVMGRYAGLVLMLAPWRRRTGAAVIIYGAGAAGMQLTSALLKAREVRPVAFVDDNPSLHGLIISGLRVHAPDKLECMIQQHRIERILVAMPSAPKADQDQLIAKLSELPIEVQVLPSYVNLIAGKSEDLKTVAPDALLGRDKVDLDTPEISKTYAGRVIMVTGAGGSIGSELCRQLLECRPAKIVLYEQSEFALYEIDRELRPKSEAIDIELTARLGSVTNAERVSSVLTSEDVDIVLHAAAYKHVPLVEDNELEGAQNNVLGTQIVADAARLAGVERFILISTDKAVRPTNVMGATKRMAELVIQDLQTRSDQTRYAMVRFGNVLGSSGSVLPLFQRQIRAGGPVTVTHAEVTRFFMTIPEAARLVLLAGAYADGGDVFVLDMGRPMKIMDIARRMIELSGARVKSDEDPDGIDIKITGLRPGEKLYEELLIDDNSLVGTPHAKILRAQERQMSQIEVAAMLKELRRALEESDETLLRSVIKRSVLGYHQQAETG